MLRRCLLAFGLSLYYMLVAAIIGTWSGAGVEMCLLGIILYTVMDLDLRKGG